MRLLRNRQLASNVRATFTPSLMPLPDEDFSLFGTQRSSALTQVACWRHAAICMLERWRRNDQETWPLSQSQTLSDGCSICSTDDALTAVDLLQHILML